MEPRDPPPARPGIADAHGVVAIVGGMVLLASSCVCWIDPIGDDPTILVIGWFGTVGLWSGLFGITTPGSFAGKGLAWLGLGCFFGALFVGCSAAVFGRF